MKNVLVTLLVLLVATTTNAQRPTELEKEMAGKMARTILQQCQSTGDVLQCFIDMGVDCKLNDKKKTREYLCATEFSVVFTNTGNAYEEDGNRYLATYRIYQKDGAWRSSRRSLRRLK